MDYVVQAAHFIAAQIEGDVRKARILDGPDDFLPMSQDRRDFIDGDFDAGYIAVIADAQGPLDVRRYGGFGRIDLSQAVRRQFHAIRDAAGQAGSALLIPGLEAEFLRQSPDIRLGQACFDHRAADGVG